MFTNPQHLAGLPPGSHHKLVLDGPVGAMEVLVDVPTTICGIVLIGHPQPMLGGSASHKIPQFLARGLQEAGWLTLRPNFRGVGGSGGKHGEAVGESDDMSWLAKEVRRANAGLPLALVGFSFGAYVMGRVAHALVQAGEPAAAVVLAGAPVGLVEAGRQYEPLQLAPNTLVVHGECDAAVRMQPVLDWCGKQAHGLMVIPGADHFFSGNLLLLRSLVVEHLRQGLGLPP